MNEIYDSLEFEKLEVLWGEYGYIPISVMCHLNKILNLNGIFDKNILTYFTSFNISDKSFKKINEKVKKGDFEALACYQYIVDNKLDQVPYENISAKEFELLRRKLFSNPEKFMSEDLKRSYYPYYAPGKTYGYKPKWVSEVTKKSRELFFEFSKSKGSDTAILIGNGPSLNKVDFDLLQGQDVFISNYAIKNKELARYAKGVAVTNHLVAEQEPYWFQLNSIWKFYPLWLAYTLPPTKTSILLNALGGDLFFSTDVKNKVAWHSTVTFFWLQILYSAGYKKVVMTGFDHYYHQESTAKEGDLIKQTLDDKNHFDPNYFKGKTWQAADTAKMEETYKLAKEFYEKDGREIVNATVGGHLEVFRRSDLSKEIPSSKKAYGRIPRLGSKFKVAIITAFWKGDIPQAEAHWRLINRLGAPSNEHIYLFKHGYDLLKPNTLPRVVCANIEKNYPKASQKPHPAGPNLVFVHTVKMLLDTEYTHFFWLEPDCIPTSKNWLIPFVERLAEYPDEAIVGTGGGTVTPGKLHWRNHFAGCSLYSLKHLANIDWDNFITNQLEVSFDVWLSAKLGYINILNKNNNDEEDTIIFGKDRHEWELLEKPKSLVYGMFEHWRPEKILSSKELEERLSWSGFSLYHAVKDIDMLKRLYKNFGKSASTIIINYNNEKYLFEAIESALNQEVDDISYEVIVVDDGSSDSSCSIINSFGSRVKAVYLEHGLLNGNFNQQRALKAALEVASGEILLLLDGDDIFYKSKVKNVCNAFDDLDIVLFQHTVDLIDERSLPMRKVFEVFPDEAIKPETYQKHHRVNFYQPTSGLAFRRSYLQSQLKHLCVDRHTNTWLDVRLTRFAPYYGKIHSSRKRLGAWRRHSNSDSIRTDNITERVQKHECWYDNMALVNNFPVVSFKWKQLLGEFSRDKHAHWDETLGIYQFLKQEKPGVMIDVGAHEGYALMPFLNDAWRVFAFEPDNKNRSRLLERLTKHKNKSLLTLDTRCVGNKSQKQVSFYTSEQSTGISGLSSFHETHEETQQVDVTTLTEFFQNKQLPDINFLKIDTEGHDLFVLEGYPWDKNKPAIIECEFEDSKTVPLGYDFHDLSRFLLDKGYTVYVSEWHPIIRYGVRHDWRQLKHYPCELSDSKGWGNLLAFKEPVDEKKLIHTIKKVLKIGGQEALPLFSKEVSYLGFWLEQKNNCFNHINSRKWLYQHSNAKQKLWIANIDVSQTKGAIFEGGLFLKADCKMIIHVSLGRAGNTHYEGVSKRVELKPGVKQCVKLSKIFYYEHKGLKLQLDVIDIGKSSKTNLTIDKLYIYESVESIRKRFGEKNITLTNANSLMRKGDYQSARGLYYLLSKKMPLGIYSDNIKMVDRKLGFDI